MVTQVETPLGLKRELRSILERHQGRLNPIGRRDLRQLLELYPKEDRKLRLLIGELRHEGTPILFATRKPSGYYLPDNLDELKDGIKVMRSYVIDECRTMRDLRILGTQYVTGQRGQLPLL